MLTILAILKMYTIPEDVPYVSFLLVITPQCGIVNCRRFPYLSIYRRYLVKVKQAVDFHLQSHKANSKKHC